MIPLPVDPVLLREHAFADTGNIAIVLNPESVGDAGGFKSIGKYGLGYFNYVLGHDKCVNEFSLKDMVRGHIFKYFNFYFIIIIAILGLWILSVSIYAECVTEQLYNLLGRKRSYKKKFEGISYDHVQV